jgi:hypothetical protein
MSGVLRLARSQDSTAKISAKNQWPSVVALPREGRRFSNFNGLSDSLGKGRLIVLQGVSGQAPKPSSCKTGRR